MESALVGVAAGVVKPLLSKLGKLLQENRAKHKSLERDIKFFRDEMETMSATLEDLADSEHLNGEMKIWRDNVRELSFDMEDCVDDFIAHGSYEHDGPTGGPIPKIRENDGRTGSLIDKTRVKLTGLIPMVREKWKKREPRNKAVSEIKQLKTRLTEASERHKRYTITLPTPDPNTSAQDPRPLLQALYPVDELMGMDDPKEEIIEKLKEFQVVSIVGPGGLGKTTLANQVYSAIKDKYSCAAFVSVSRKPNIQALLRDLAKRVGITQTTPSDDVRQLIEMLREYLKDKRYFIVIDDLWEVVAWETIFCALIKNECGSRIITTTRKQEVASTSSKGGYVYQMRPLSFSHSKNLFFERAFGVEKQDHPHLQKVSSEILKKCDGLPLAIITIAGMLSQKYDLDECERVLAAIGCALANETGADNMTKILSLSYFDLPHHLRTCFLYLSLFPEDRHIQKEQLISRWVAEGFINETKGQSAYEVGEGYFNELSNRSLIQVFYSGHYQDEFYGEAYACRVHDIVVDFITCKAAEENFATAIDAEEDTNHSNSRRVRRLCINNRTRGSRAAMPTSLKFSHVRSLTLYGKFMAHGFSAFPYLRVLDMRDEGDMVPHDSQLQDHAFEDLHKLVFLKYLKFGNNGVRKLPQRIGDLQHLETLDISDTRISKLPSTISRLQQLARLRVPRNTVFPVGAIGQMKSLEELDQFTISSIEQVRSLKEFSQLTKLRKLIVLCGDVLSNDFQSHVGTLISTCSLQHLCFLNYVIGNNNRHIVLSTESWFSPAPCKLLKLRFTCCYIDKVPEWMSSCANLTALYLRVFSVAPEDFMVLGAIPTLFSFILETETGHEGMILIPGGDGFRILNFFRLTIMECGTSLAFESGSMPKLEHLKLDIPSHTMKCLNGASDFGINHLSALTMVVIYNLPLTVQQLVKAATETLPKYPAIRFHRIYKRTCTLNCSFEERLRLRRQG